MQNLSNTASLSLKNSNLSPPTAVSRCPWRKGQEAVSYFSLHFWCIFSCSRGWHKKKLYKNFFKNHVLPAPILKNHTFTCQHCLFKIRFPFLWNVLFFIEDSLKKYTNFLKNLYCTLTKKIKIKRSCFQSCFICSFPHTFELI